MSELPKECTLPVGVEWCSEEDGTAFFLVRRPSSEHFVKGSTSEIVLIGVAWEELFPDERKDKSARCAMWWEAEEDKRSALLAEDDEAKYSAYVFAHNAMMAWKELWRELEGKA